MELCEYRIPHIPFLTTQDYFYVITLCKIKTSVSFLMTWNNALTSTGKQEQSGIKRNFVNFTKKYCCVTEAAYLTFACWNFPYTSGSRRNVIHLRRKGIFGTVVSSLVEYENYQSKSESEFPVKANTDRFSFKSFYC